MITNNIDAMTANEFRASYGVPVHALGETRQTLAMQRDALRDVYGDTWREDWQEIEAEFNEEDEPETDSLTLQDKVNVSEFRNYGRKLTCELVDSFEE